MKAKVENIISGTEIVAVLILIVAIMTATTAFVFVHGATDNFKKYSSIKKLSDAVDNGNFDDDNINYKSFKAWHGYQDASSKVQHCLDKKHSLGNNLGDYEIYDCVG